MSIERERRERLADRFGGWCPWCGMPLTGEFAVHHRKLRKHGGTNEASNLVALHHGCHNGTTKSVHLNPNDAYRRGFLVRSYQDPARIPLVYHTGIKVTLDNNWATVHDITGGSNGW